MPPTARSDCPSISLPLFNAKNKSPKGKTRGWFKIFRGGASLSILFLFALSSCAALRPAPPPPSPAGPDGTAIGMSLIIRLPVKFFKMKKDITVFFRRVDKDETDGGIPQMAALRPSNFSRDNRVYLLNAPPGRYAPVVAFFELKRTPPQKLRPDGTFAPAGPPEISQSWTFFPSEFIAQNEVTVGRNEIAFAGDFVIDQSLGMGKADETQRYYYRFIFTSVDKIVEHLNRGIGDSVFYYGLMGSETIGLSSQIIAAVAFDEYSYRGSAYSMKKDDAARREFLSKAAEDLSDPDWYPIVQNTVDPLPK